MKQTRKTRGQVVHCTRRYLGQHKNSWQVLLTTEIPDMCAMCDLTPCLLTINTGEMP